MYLVDTNVISEARRRNPEAVAWLRRARPSQLYLSVVTLGEIACGIALKQASDPQAASHLSEWFGVLRTEHRDRILPITEQIAVEWGRLAARRPRGDADGLIAATATVHDLVLVTRNIRDFEDAGIAIENPWAI